MAEKWQPLEYVIARRNGERMMIPRNMVSEEQWKKLLDDPTVEEIVDTRPRLPSDSGKEVIGGKSESAYPQKEHGQYLRVAPSPDRKADEPGYIFRDKETDEEWARKRQRLDEAGLLRGSDADDSRRRERGTETPNDTPMFDRYASPKSKKAVAGQRIDAAGQDLAELRGALEAERSRVLRGGPSARRIAALKDQVDREVEWSKDESGRALDSRVAGVANSDRRIAALLSALSERDDQKRREAEWAADEASGALDRADQSQREKQWATEESAGMHNQRVAKRNPSEAGRVAAEKLLGPLDDILASADLPTEKKTPEHVEKMKRDVASWFADYLTGGEEGRADTVNSASLPVEDAGTSGGTRMGQAARMLGDMTRGNTGAGGGGGGGGSYEGGAGTSELAERTPGLMESAGFMQGNILMNAQNMGHAVLPNVIPAAPPGGFGAQFSPQGQVSQLPDGVTAPQAPYAGPMARPPEGGSASMSLDMGPTPSPATPAPGIYAGTQELKALKDMAVAQGEAVKAAGEAEAEGMRQQADILRERQAKEDLLVAKAAERQAALAQETESRYQAYTGLLQEMREPDRIDPDRFWASRSTAQKVFAVLAAGLTQGKSIEQVNAAIDRDVAAQKADIANKRDYLNQKAALAGNVYQMARQRGLDDIAATSAAKADLYARSATQMEMVSKLSGSEQKRAAAAAQAIGFQQAAVAEEMKMKQHFSAQAMQLWAHKENFQLERDKMARDSFQMALKAAGGGNPKEATSAVLMDLGNAAAGVDLLDKFIADNKSDIGGIDAFFNKFTRKLPGTKAEDMDIEVDKLMLQLAHKFTGVMSGPEIKNWTERVGNSGTFSLEKRLRALRDMAVAGYTAQRRALQEGGYDVGRLRTFDSGGKPAFEK